MDEQLIITVRISGCMNIYLLMSNNVVKVSFHFLFLFLFLFIFKFQCCADFALDK